jgi:hypothetical protein
LVRFRQDTETQLPVARSLGQAAGSLALPPAKANGSGKPGHAALLPGPATPPDDVPLAFPLPSPPEVKLLADSLASVEPSNASLLPLLDQVGTLHQQMFGQFQQATMMLVQMFTSLQGEQLGLIREELQRLHGLTEELQKLHARSPSTAPAQIPLAAALPRKNGSAAPKTATAVDLAETKKPSPVADAVRDSSPSPPRPAEANMHAWITQRIAAIQEEQQSSWQRILQFVVGRRAEDPVL